MSQVINDQDSATPTARPRLDSWKEIAVYLKRGIRTVRRWEQQEGLPVHRHRHGKQATIYAFPHEIDTWLEGREHAGQLPLVRRHTEASGPKMSRQARRNRPAVIAILPLRNVSHDPEQERFAEGLTEELIQEIGYRCPTRLRVIAFTSVMRYKRSTKNIRQIGHELGADYILEGGIRRYGDRVRLEARLIAATDQTHIWADTYEVQLPPIFSLQQALAKQVAESLAISVQAKAKKTKRRTDFPNIDAHNAFIESRSHFLPTEGDSTKSIEQLNLAIERDPKFAPSYAELALSYLRRLFWDYPPIVTFRRIEEQASEALRLNPKLARAHSMMGAFHLFSAWNWPKAEMASRHAMELNPSDPWAHIVRAAYYIVVGKLEEAIETLKRVCQLDPQSVETGIWFAILAYFARRPDLAIEHDQKIIQLDPSSAFAHMVLGLALAQKGDYGLALKHCDQARELGANSISQISRACTIYALAGKRQYAERLWEELISAEETQYARYIFLAQASASLGREREAIGWIEKAYQQREALLIFLRADVRFDTLSGVPGFRNILRGVGIPADS